jgi:hypothetical protein
VVAVGDASKIKTVLDKYGPVEIVTPPSTAAEGAGKAAGAGL